jgi:penicillin-binding protein 1A
VRLRLASRGHGVNLPEPMGDPMQKPPTRRWLRVLRWSAICLVVGLASVVGSSVAADAYFSRGLPSVDTLRNYHPPQVTKVFCDDGSVCAEFFSQRRTVIDASTLPAYVRNAFLAAEDADFYHHDGLDYAGMFKAGLRALFTGHVTGASTITQQACRNILLTQERTLSRKIREWILSLRMEKSLTKDEILNLYLNQVAFGHGRWGVEEAALYYFGKHAKDLTIGEAASLAGTVQLPERINPVTNMVKAKKRQQYVLHQMAKHGFLPEEVIAKELDRPIVLAPPPPPQVGPYYVEEIRRMLTARYGDEAVQSGGMRVTIAMRPALQQAADAAVQDGLELLDRRMGYQGPIASFDAQKFGALRPLIAQRISEAGKRHKNEELLADLAALAQAPQAEAADDEGIEPGAAEDEEPVSADELTAGKVELVPAQEGARLAGYVSQIDDGGKFALVDLVGRTARIDFATITWARPRGVGKHTPAPKKISDVLKVGDLVRVRLTQLTPAPMPLAATLYQVPQVQGALVAIDPATRKVVALTGGYDFARSSFNRATQAHRQPGSSFKPFVYGAALLSQKFTPISVMNDAPDPIRDPYTHKVWKPQNYERDGFDGPMTLRKALAESKNTISVRLVEALTPPAVIDFAKRAGIHDEMPENFTIGLGTGEVTPLEIANAYSTLDSLGKYSDPVLLTQVADAHGKVLEEHAAAFEETLPPPIAYLVTSMMQSVINDPGGTGATARELNRAAAAKTGTASEFRDAWFIGYTPDLVTAAWVGFDDHSSLGSGETGAKAALPLWLEFMKHAEDGVPAADFQVPPGVAVVRIDPSTGLLAGSAVPGHPEPFLEGTAPTAQAPAPNQVREDSFFLQDRRSRL